MALPMRNGEKRAFSIFAASAYLLPGFADGFTTGYSRSAIHRHHVPLRVSSLTADAPGWNTQPQRNSKASRPNASPPQAIKVKPQRQKKKSSSTALKYADEKEASEIQSTDFTSHISSLLQDDQPKHAQLQSKRSVPAAMKRPRVQKNDESTHDVANSVLTYNQTELLSPQEEYSLALKVHFMTKCEEVYAGLSHRLKRMPAIEEWACACGFDAPGPGYVVSETDQQIRPSASVSGNTKKRSKPQFPIRLGKYYNDIVEKFPQADGKNGGSKTKKTKRRQPMNRGKFQNFIQIMRDGKEAKQRLVQCNMRLVATIAYKYRNEGLSVQDLIQEGSLGLSRAAEKFDPSRGFRFSTYASWWIQQAVFQAIGNDARTIRVPMYVHNNLIKARRARAVLQQELGRTPTPKEVAHELGMAVGKYQKMMSLSQQPISLETPRYQPNTQQDVSSKETLLSETVAGGQDDVNDNPELLVNRELFHQDIHKIMEGLSQDERQVIKARYGLDNDGKARTVSVLEKEWQQSKSRIRNAEARAIRKLRQPRYEKMLKEHQQALAC